MGIVLKSTQNKKTNLDNQISTTAVVYSILISKLLINFSSITAMIKLGHCFVFVYSII